MTRGASRHGQLVAAMTEAERMAPGAFPETARLPLALLIDSPEAYRRPVSETKVRRILREFDPVKVKPVLVNPNGLGSFHRLDGNRTAEVLARRGEADALCLIRPIPFDQEWRYFATQHDNETRVSAYDRHVAGASDGRDATAQAIDRALGAVGLRISRSSRAGGPVVTCVTALREIVQKAGEGHLEDVATVLTTAWPVERGERPGRFAVHIWMGVSAFLWVYPEVEPLEAGRKLGFFDPEDVAPRRASGAVMRVMDSEVRLALAIAYLYNHGRRTKTVDPERITLSAIKKRRDEA